MRLSFLIFSQVLSDNKINSQDITTDLLKEINNVKYYNNAELGKNTTSAVFSLSLALLFMRSMLQNYKHTADFPGSFPNKYVTLTYMDSNYTWNFLRSHISGFFFFF